MTESTEPKRSDARRNRDAILAAALEALTTSPDASLNAIARRAGVANATLYRHFPTREELVLAAYQHEVQKLVDAADALLRNKAPIDALRIWIDRLAQYAVTKHGLADALRKATARETTCHPPIPTTRSSPHLTASCRRTSPPARCAPASTPTTSSSHWPASGSSTPRAIGEPKHTGSTTSSSAGCNAPPNTSRPALS
jgi:AcrR family transcriptional regulator